MIFRRDLYRFRVVDEDGQADVHEFNATPQQMQPKKYEAFKGYRTDESDFRTGGTSVAPVQESCSA
jgi:hypothetical protein